MVFAHEALTQQASLDAGNTAVLFLIHGTRNPKAVPMIRKTLQGLCGAFAEKNQLPRASVTYCFLEFLQPSLEHALMFYSKKGKTDLRIIPLLLFPGTHLYNDVPEAIDALKKEYPHANVGVADHIGVEEPEMMMILLKRLVQSADNTLMIQEPVIL